MPTDLIDVLTVDDDNTLDIVAMIEKLHDVPGGDIVQVEADDATVRVWVE